MAVKRKLLAGDGWSFEPAAPAAAPDVVSLPSDRQKAAIKLEKRATGKEVTRITGFVLSAADRKALAVALKKSCGAGGAEDDAGIDIQGDHREAARKFLAATGWRV